jgi:fucose 4-O-acetylase-like acetyltransferase
MSDTRVHRPTSRDLGIDAYRAFAMFVVVAWHWVFTIATWSERGPRVDNPISHLPALGYLTWALQVMPLFFLVGGHVAARSLATHGDASTASWAGRRLRRLVVPAVPLLGALLAAYVLARTFDAAALARAIVLIATPLWFLAAYVAVVAVLPVVHRAARRWPTGHVAALVGICLLWDLARFSGRIGGAALWCSMLLVWLTVHQAGGLLDLVDRRTARLLIAGGLGALWVGTTVGPYPVSMVGNRLDELSNMGPPTAILLALAAVQLGLVALTRPMVTRWSQRHRGVVDTAARHAMPVYLWHMVGFGVCVVAVTAVGIELPAEPTWQWWVTRPLWVLGPLLVARPLIRWSAGTPAPERRA